MRPFEDFYVLQKCCHEKSKTVLFCSLKAALTAYTVILLPFLESIFLLSLYKQAPIMHTLHMQVNINAHTQMHTFSFIKQLPIYNVEIMLC